jgi:hypothetical protein
VLRVALMKGTVSLVFLVVVGVVLTVLTASPIDQAQRETLSAETTGYLPAGLPTENTTAPAQLNPTEFGFLTLAIFACVLVAYSASLIMLKRKRR